MPLPDKTVTEHYEGQSTLSVQANGQTQECGLRMYRSFRGRFSRQDDEDRLSHILGHLGFPDLPKGRGINQVSMTRHQGFKGGL